MLIFQDPNSSFDRTLLLNLRLYQILFNINRGTAVERVTEAVAEMELTDGAADTFEEDFFDSNSTHSSMPRLATLLEQSDSDF
ncbi:uncharacterized protein PHACADRAFT_203324 [Phanerochaete carnosa HHB-10118-sp]|uniref:Uncharacterized protein n=1 Tax=Phanerochaete carnosa (strain HHB-10118-sp) TaxID=650164 RepID=K5WCY2_PHACS|nr:uncharacterized protein PHACADRAFT_203324 [Phanerochaete carnosa HHB-10118-sp]EKM48047.1 hypothetical protein PHACADRAFT_203324 [Phanerochaete carnosa HHB-10118-sp]